MTSRDQVEDYWTEPRLELRAWFNRNAPSLGELYEGSLRMLFMYDFPGRTRFIAHAVREIRNRLPDVIAGTNSKETVQYKNRLDVIVKDWEKAGFSLEGTIPMEVTMGHKTLSNDVPMPRKLWEKIAILIKDHIKARERPEEAASRLFEGIVPENQALRDTLRPVIHQWLNVTDWFQKKVHDSGARDNDIDGNEFLRKFELFEIALRALVRGFFKTTEELDEILENANS
jgi:hypothetical protein